MVRNRKRKTAIGIFSAEAMKQAVAMAVRGSSISEAAETHKVTRNTLHRYVQRARGAPQGGAVKLRPNYACRRLFSNEEEETMKDYLIDCPKMTYGLSGKNVRVLAYEAGLRNEKKVPDMWHRNKMAVED